MDDFNKEPLKVVYLPIEGAQNVWMYTTILALTIFIYFLLKGIRSMWNDVPRFGARSILRQMYSVNNGVGDGWACIHVPGGFALSAPLASTSNSDSTSTQFRRNAHPCPSEATSANGCGEGA